MGIGKMSITLRLKCSVLGTCRFYDDGPTRIPILTISEVFYGIQAARLIPEIRLCNFLSIQHSPRLETPSALAYFGFRADSVTPTPMQPAVQAAVLLRESAGAAIDHFYP